MYAPCWQFLDRPGPARHNAGAGRASARPHAFLPPQASENIKQSD